jgi:hypothetical protein
MSSLAEMRKELREMRKETVKPVSRMKKGDISHEIEALRARRETTPAAASVPSAPPKGMKPDVENIKDVKKSVFMKPAAKAEKAEKMPKEKAEKAEKVEGKAKMSTKAKLMKMLADMSDD